MMRCRFSAKSFLNDGMRLNISAGFYLSLAVYLLWIPIPWLLAWFFAAMLHECMHMLALRICGYRIFSLHIGFGGASIQTDGETGGKMILCALAGPLTGVLLLPFLTVIPRIVLCGLLQSLVNLLPIYPLDGGRVIRNLTMRYASGKTGDILCRVIEYITGFLLWLTALTVSVRLQMGCAPAFAVICLLVIKKYLAKKSTCEYNIVK